MSANSGLAESLIFQLRQQGRLWRAGVDGVSAASEAWLLEAMTSRIPMQITRRLDMLSFLTHHEGYHLGQMGSARKALGLPVLLDALRAADAG